MKLEIKHVKGSETQDRRGYAKYKALKATQTFVEKRDRVGCGRVKVAGDVRS